MKMKDLISYFVVGILIGAFIIGISFSRGDYNAGYTDGWVDGIEHAIDNTKDNYFEGCGSLSKDYYGFDILKCQNQNGRIRNYYIYQEVSGKTHTL